MRLDWTRDRCGPESALAPNLVEILVHLVAHHLFPLLRRRESHLLRVAALLSAERLDHQCLDVSDRGPRLREETIGDRSELPSAIWLASLEYRAEAEPGESVPLPHVEVAGVMSKPVTDVLIAREADVVRPVIVVEHIDPALPAEVADLKFGSEEPVTAKDAIHVLVARAWRPDDLVGSPEESERPDEAPPRRCSSRHEPFTLVRLDSNQRKSS